MGSFRFDRLLELATSVDLMLGLLWGGLACLTIALLVLMRTRWGQSRPLRKCLVLSVLAHLLLVGYATTVNIVASAPLAAKEQSIDVSLTEEEIARTFDVPNTTAPVDPWDALGRQPALPPEPVEVARAESAELEPEALPANAPTEPAAPPLKSAEPIEAPSAQRREGVRTDVPDRPQLERRQPYADTSQSPPERSARPGLPSPLLEQPLPMPRLAHVQTTPNPEQSLAGLNDSLTRAAQGKPAEWSTPQSPQTGVRTDAAPAPGMGPSAPATQTIRPPSLAMRDSTGASGLDAMEPVRGNPDVLGAAMLPTNRRDSGEHPLPPIYRLRMAPDRSRLAQLNGATPETETAVKAALAWLAANQSADGHWDAKSHGAGRELLVAGRDRQGAGSQADTGLTGLALLAFLASGHTHQDGLYQSNVRRGLEYLLSIQGRDGNLGGKAATYEFMYCHAMAACALSEAYGMTGDPGLREPVYRAVQYTLAAQDPSGGGWRYSPGDPGDTSQLGWQLMALRSAELAGIPIPERARQGVSRYLESASSGQYGGLAAYRPVEGPSRPMTAEALVCRFFLGLTPAHPAAKEAADYIGGELPGEGRKNLYYWYYATLGMYYLQGEQWERWNQAVQKTLIGSQQKRGSLAGSWDADSVWGGYGGRVYSTALATLCLEVYYRFLPLYLQASGPRSLPR
jgi:hypothetical protein